MAWRPYNAVQMANIQTQISICMRNEQHFTTMSHTWVCWFRYIYKFSSGLRWIYCLFSSLLFARCSLFGIHEMGTEHPHNRSIKVTFSTHLVKVRTNIARTHIFCVQHRKLQSIWCGFYGIFVLNLNWIELNTSHLQNSVHWIRKKTRSFIQNIWRFLCFVGIGTDWDVRWKFDVASDWFNRITSKDFIYTCAS